MPTAIAKNLQQLVSAHCASLDFIYGTRAVTAGSQECRVFLNLTEEDGQFLYSGTLCIPGTVISGAKRIPFQLVDSPQNEVTDIVAVGRLADGGAFQFPVSTGLIGRKCRLELDPPVSERPDGLPRRTLRRSPRKTTAGASSRLISGSGHVIDVGARFVTLKVPTASIPYNLACLAAWAKTSKELTSVRMVHLTQIGETQFSEARCERGLLMQGRPETEVFIDAWPVTIEPETRLLVTPRMLQELRGRNPETAVDVERLIQDIQILTDDRHKHEHEPADEELADE